MTDSTNPTDYNYFLDSNGDVWRQPVDGGPREVMAPGSWLVSYPDSHLVIRPLTLGKPTLPTEPGLYVVNYDDDLALFDHVIVYLNTEGTQWCYFDNGETWNPREGDTLTRLDVVGGEK